MRLLKLLLTLVFTSPFCFCTSVLNKTIEKRGEEEEDIVKRVLMRLESANQGKGCVIFIDSQGNHF